MAVLSMALAIGPNAALFSVMDRVLLQGGLADAPDSVQGIRIRGRAGFEDLSYTEFHELKDQTSAFGGVAAAFKLRGVLVHDDWREMIATSLVSSGYLDLIQVHAQRGRMFRAEDDSASGFESVPVLISDDLWRRRFDGDRDIFGQQAILNNRSVTIVGVTQPGFRGLNPFSPVDVWMPMDAWLAGDSLLHRQLTSPDVRAMQIFASLRNGVPPDRARLELQRLANHFAEVRPATSADRTLVMWSARSDDARRRVGVSAVVLGLMGLVLVVACTNVSLILLARAEGRRRDAAVRMAIGASRWQLLRLLATEALLLSAIAGAVGLLLGRWLIGLTPLLKPVTLLPIPFDFGMNATCVTYTILITVVTTVICVIVPMWRTSSGDLLNAIRREDSNQTVGGAKARRRFALILGAQIALTQVLLTGGGLLLRSYWKTNETPLGLDPNRPILLVTVVSPTSDIHQAVVHLRYADTVEHLRALPGVTRVTFTQNPPLSGFGDTVVKVDGGPGTPPLKVPTSTIGRDYLQMIGTKVLKGRDFAQWDTAFHRSAVVNQTLVRQLFPASAASDDVIGRALQIDGRPYEILGIVEDGKYGSVREAPQPHIYFTLPAPRSDEATLVVETATAPEAIAPSVRRIVEATTPGIWVAGMTALSAHVRLARILDEFGAYTTVTMGALCLILASVGLFGLTAFWVERRKRECGLRLALGATLDDIIGLLQRQTLTPVLIGAVIGLVLAVALGRALSAVLFGVSAFDPVALGGSAFFTALMGFVTSRIPAQKCARITPDVFLRQE